MGDDTGMQWNLLDDELPYLLVLYSIYGSYRTMPEPMMAVTPSAILVS
jgi:hypothetical protein